MRLFSPLYARAMRWARHRHAPAYLGTMSFAESSFFPVPPDVMLAPMCLARPDRAWRFALLTTLTSVAGGLAGYAIGYYAFEAVAPWLQTTKYWASYQTAVQWFNDYGFWAVFIAGFSPIPYKVFTILSGLMQMQLVPFLIASVIGRSLRFFLVGALIFAFGKPVRSFIDRYFNLVALLFFVLLIGFFAVLGI